MIVRPCMRSRMGSSDNHTPRFAYAMSAAAAIQRSNSRAKPGQAPGKVEYRRCMEVVGDNSESELDYSAAQRQGDGVGPVVGAQLGQDVPDVCLGGSFVDLEPGCDRTVGIAGGDESQDLDLADSQGGVPVLAVELRCDCRFYLPGTTVHRAN